MDGVSARNASRRPSARQKNGKAPRHRRDRFFERFRRRSGHWSLGLSLRGAGAWRIDLGEICVALLLAVRRGRTQAGARQPGCGYLQVFQFVSKGKVSSTKSMGAWAAEHLAMEKAATFSARTPKCQRFGPLLCKGDREIRLPPSILVAAVLRVERAQACRDESINERGGTELAYLQKKLALPRHGIFRKGGSRSL